MANVAPRALYVGLNVLDEFLRKVRPDWEFLPTVPDIATLWDGLLDGTIQDDFDILLILDAFYNPTGEDKTFEQIIAYTAPYHYLGIINYKPNLKSQMKDSIDYEAYNLGIDSSSLLYYFIDIKQPNKSFDMSINDYKNKSTEKRIIAHLNGQEYYEEEETEEENPAALESFYETEDEEENKYLGQVIAITSSKGGSGKSTVATAVATYLAHSSQSSVREGLEKEPLKIVVLDLDVRDGQLGFLTGNTTPNIINIRKQGVSKESIEDTAIYDPKLKVDLLLAPKRPRLSDDTPTEFYVELIHTLRKMYDYIILDTSVNYLDPLLEKVAYPMADKIIFVTDIVINSVFSMTRWIQEVTRSKEQNGMGINKNKIGIVVNKSLQNVEMPGRKIAKAAQGVPVLVAIPSNPRLMSHAANIQSMSVILKNKETAASIRRIAKLIVGKQYNLSNNLF